MVQRKIHVLQMIGEFTSGGAESVVVNLANNIDQSQFKLTFTARKNGPVSTSLPNNSDLVIIPKKNGFDPYHLALLVQLIRRNDIDIVHSHLFGPNLFGFLAAKITGRKIIQTIHGRDCFGTIKRLWAYRFMMPWVDYIVSVSEPLEVELRKKLKINKAQIKTIHNGVALNKLNRPVDREGKLRCIGLPTNCKIIGAVGNIKPIKGYDVLLKALLILKKRKTPNFILAIVGEVFPKHEYYKKMLDDFIKKNDLEDQVLFLGYRQDVKEILSLFDLYVLPSRSEGLSMSLLEAMAACKPVIVTDVGMNSRIIKNFSNGLIVESESAESIAEGIIKVLKDEDFAIKIAINALKTIQEKYSDKQMAYEYMSLYKAVLNTQIKNKWATKC
ncbi:MAG: glycosyltransferase [Candidatus Jordarchaeaceae archaeon]